MAESKLRNNIVGNPSQFGGGGNNMNDYVTHSEFKTGMDAVNQRIDDSNNRIDKLTAAIYTLAGIVVSGLVIPMLLMVIKLLFFK